MAVVIGVDLFGCVVNGTGGGGPAWESGGMGDITGVGAELAGEPEGRDGHSGSTMGERRADGSVISKRVMGCYPGICCRYAGESVLQPGT